MKQTQTLRQGDVLLRVTTQQPSARAQKVRDNGRIILAYGEVTGHAHEVIGVAVDSAAINNADPVAAQELFEEPNGRRILVVRTDALLRHEEHDRIDLPAGNYEVIRQNEYTPAAIRNVAD